MIVRGSDGLEDDRAPAEIFLYHRALELFRETRHRLECFDLSGCFLLVRAPTPVKRENVVGSERYSGAHFISLTTISSPTRASRIAKVAGS